MLTNSTYVYDCHKNYIRKNVKLKLILLNNLLNICIVEINIFLYNCHTHHNAFFKHILSVANIQTNIDNFSSLLVNI